AAFADTQTFMEHRDAWIQKTAGSPERLLGARRVENALVWDARASLLAWDAALVGTAVVAERTPEGLRLSGVKLSLRAGAALAATADFRAAAGPFAFFLGRHTLSLDERGRPEASAAGTRADADDTRIDFAAGGRLDARATAHDPANVFEEGSPVVIFKLDGTRLAKVPH